jgi:hypothetical protein
MEGIYIVTYIIMTNSSAQKYFVDFKISDFQVS